MANPDLENLLRQARQMQDQFAKLQEELANRTVEGSAGGGMVTAVATGNLRIREIRIEPQLISDGDRAMLQDLVAAAVNAALGNAQEMVQKAMQENAGPFGALLSRFGTS